MICIWPRKNLLLFNSFIKKWKKEETLHLTILRHTVCSGRRDLFLSRGLDFLYLHEEKSGYEGGALAIAHFTVVDGIGFHHIEQGLLAHAVFLLEKLVLRVGASDIPANSEVIRSVWSKVRRQKFIRNMTSTTLTFVWPSHKPTGSSCIRHISVYPKSREHRKGVAKPFPGNGGGCLFSPAPVKIWEIKICVNETRARIKADKTRSGILFFWVSPYWWGE